jgi:hypothetical protein
MNIHIEDMILDDDWIKHFDSTDRLYKDFYKDNLYYVNLTIVYINQYSEMDKIKQESFLLTKPNQVLYEEIIDILKKNSIDNNKRYSLLSILKYNFTIEPEDLKYYMCNNLDGNYLSVIKNIDTIFFEKTISMFHDLNDLVIIFYEKTENTHQQKSPNNTTKKIYLHSNTSSITTSRKKTIKKRYKD